MAKRQTTWHRKARTPSEKELEALDRVIAFYGNPNRASAKIGISNAGLAKWRIHGIPAERVLKLSKATGIPTWKLRPDLYKRPKVERVGEAATL